MIAGAETGMGAATRAIVGQPHARVDGRDKVTGKALYTADLVLPGMAHAALLRSPLPHARLVRIDASRAEALPGVVRC